jgi:hypothetical protein
MIIPIFHKAKVPQFRQLLTFLSAFDVSLGAGNCESLQARAMVKAVQLLLLYKDHRSNLSLMHWWALLKVVILILINPDQFQLCKSTTKIPNSSNLAICSLFITTAIKNKSDKIKNFYREQAQSLGACNSFQCREFDLFV